MAPTWFTQLEDPLPTLLHREFEALGYSSEMLGEGVNFMELVMKLADVCIHGEILSALINAMCQRRK